MYKKLMVLLVVGFMLFFHTGNIHAAGSNPEKVRIGLFFGSTSVSKADIGAQNGLLIGYEQNGTFVTLIESMNSDTFSIQKDTWHIQIGSEVRSGQEAESQVLQLKSKGVNAYPAFDGAWKVWTGTYPAQDAAQKEINDNLSKKLGSGDCKLVSPSDSSIQVVNRTGEVKLVYNGNSLPLLIKPGSSNNTPVLSINGIPYRGDVEITRKAGSDMTVVNVLPLEQYLYSVVPSEMGPSFHPEALKAQSVVSRTYTLKSMTRHSSQGFNLCAGTHCQVYKGFSNEHPNTSRAVDETKGIKLTYNGRPADVFYFSSSGGMTEDPKYVWGYENPVLKSVSDEYEDQNASNVRWSVTLSRQQIKQALAAKGKNIGEVVDVKAGEYSPAGRVSMLTIIGTSGEAVLLRNDIRSTLGYNVINSQWFTINGGTGSDGSGDGQPAGESSGNGGRYGTFVRSAEKVQEMQKPVLSLMVLTGSGQKSFDGSLSVARAIVGGGAVKSIIEALDRTPALASRGTGQPGGTTQTAGDGFTFTGKGWGHGVGMSQRGAQGRALAGFKYDEILLHYFTGVKLE